MRKSVKWIYLTDVWIRDIFGFVNMNMETTSVSSYER